MDCRGEGILPATLLNRGKQEKRPMFSVIPCQAARLEAAPPEVMRCFFRWYRVTFGGAASCRAFADGVRDCGRGEKQTGERENKGG